MADASVAVTAGTGTSIDTRTEATNGNHRQVVVVGDPSTNAGIAPVDATAGLKVDLGADNDVTVSGATLTAIQAAVEILDNAISGSEMQVDVVAALPTGANTIGAVNIAAAQTLATVTTVGTVTTLTGTTTLTPGTGATNLGKARDTAIGATDTGVAMLGVRRDTPTAETPAAGDYIVPQYSANGEAWVRHQGELADDAAFTVGTTRVMPVGLLADETATDSVDEGDAGIPRMTLDRKQIVTPLAHTNGGGTAAKLVSAASTNATSLKASAGQVYMISAFNINAAVRYLKLYNKASAPTVGTDTPVQVYAIPGAATGGGFTLSIPVGMEFTTGIAYALTTGITDADTGAVAASELLVNIVYK